MNEEFKHRVSPHKPVGDWFHGTYRGPVIELKGEGALLSFNPQNQHIAQFDSVDTGYGYGWHLVDGRDFERDEDDFPRFV